MINNQLNKTPMPVQEPMVRATNFEEVNIGYSLDEALNEASRCLNCRNSPCVSGCPVNVNIPQFIKKIRENDIDGAYGIITLDNNFPSICGRVCPQENQCEGKCVRGIKGQSVGIGNLERFVGDHAHKAKLVEPIKFKYKVALIGSGPSSLACASELINNGIQPVIFEALHSVGGVLAYGIPEFRLPKKIVHDEIENLKQKGLIIHQNIVVGRTYSFEDLFNDGYKAIFIGVGAGLPRFMNIKGESAIGVFSANEYLTRVNLMKAYKEEADTPILRGKHTIVVGGGNVAMDAARSALRMGNKVSLVYRRSMVELPARKEEVHHAQEEGINFELLRNPVEILTDENGRVSGVKVIQMKLVESENGGRRQVKPIEGSEYVIECDSVIMAIGTSSNPLLTSSASNLALNERGYIIVDENQMTSIDNVYAAGDIVTGAATVIKAMGQGKKAAIAIVEKNK